MDHVPQPHAAKPAPAPPSTASGKPDANRWPAPQTLLDPESDLGTIERTLLAFATHPQGAGASRAWLLVWNSRSGLVEGWREAASSASPTLEQALSAARRAGSPDGASERIHAWAESPDRLEGPVAHAWRAQAIASGDGGEQPGAPWAESSRIGAVPLRRGTRAYGVLVCVWAGTVSHEAEALEWLRAAAESNFGAQRRAVETRRLARQARANAELARTSVSAVNLAEVLHLVTRLAAEAVDARGAVLYRTEARGSLKVEVAHGQPVMRDTCARGFLAAAREACATGQACAGERGDEVPHLPPGVSGETSTWAIVPLVAYGRCLGALVVYDGLDRHPCEGAYERADLDHLAALADHAALVLEHARIGEEGRRREQLRSDQSARLRELDRLAAIGEMAVRVAQESRNPLASIAAFVKRAHRELPEEDARREYLEIVLRETERLETMLGEQMEYSQLQRPSLEMQNLNGVVQEALQRFSESLVRRRVRLLKRLAPDLPMLLLDAHRIRRVVENVVAFALESVPMGGRIRVDSRRAADHVVVEIAHDGVRHAGDLLDQLFVPFASGGTAGAAVGLGVAQQIVREHGGEVRLRADGEWSTIFSFTLPIAGNEDRRKAPDRRSVRGERRRRRDDDGTRGS
ncbi:MAG: GAF domain-containing protein [Candidatus Eisenbacteria bacterium]|uniref:GAF domain-containing protein n=1 Tax=Eiseniibacteriota bacterium TaxID=2212470 RepID=A0A933SA92_UNCEI|nr:GAF domain-containing protein [Candidatus Eisenbacteria bacterium]